jgi:hypothetical protein
MRRSRFPIPVFAVWWAIASVVHGQEMRQSESGPQDALQQAFAEAKVPDVFGEFRRNALMGFPGTAYVLAVSASADGQQHKTKAPPSPEPVQRPPIDPSMVGYIDDALIHSQIRVRFDAALHDPTPDRAEFFYAKCGCYRNLNDPHAPGPGMTIPDYVNFQQLNIYGEYAFKGRYSLFGTIPVRWLQSEGAGNFGSESGLGDIQLGAKASPFSSETRVLTFQFASHIASGDARNGLGTHHATLEPMVLYYQGLGRGSIEAEFGDTHPLGTSWLASGTGPGFAGDVLTYGAGGSYQLVRHDSTWVAGVLEMVGWHILGGNVTDKRTLNFDTDGVNIVNLKVGPRVSFAGHHSVYFGYGIALTSAEWYHEIFRSEYRYTF